MTAIESQTNIAKMNELENLKKQEVYCEEEDIGQSDGASQSDGF